MTEGMRDDVVKLRTGALEWRVAGLALRMDPEDARRLTLKAMELLGWSAGSQRALEVDGQVALIGNDRQLIDEREKLRANGVVANVKIVKRPLLIGEWSDPASENGEPARSGQRRFVKEAARPGVQAPPRKLTERKPAPNERADNDPTITMQLFADPQEQLHYEIRHAYLMTVPISQRQQWPFPSFTMTARFLADVAAQSQQISRGQIIAAIVDVVTGRISEVNSRRPRPLREGGGDDGRPVISRSTDGATAWRANVNTGTPAARRIMWWKTPTAIELARLAIHDDVEMPER